MESTNEVMCPTCNVAVVPTAEGTCPTCGTKLEVSAAPAESAEAAA